MRVSGEEWQGERYVQEVTRGDAEGRGRQKKVRVREKPSSLTSGQRGRRLSLTESGGTVIR